MADVKFAITREALSTATAGNTQNFTAPSGFGEPKAAIFLLSDNVTSGSGSPDATLCIGFAVSPTQEESCSSFSNDNAATTQTFRYQKNSCIYLTGDGTPLAEFEFTQWLNVADDGIDGVQLTIVTAAASAYLCQIIWIGGADVSNVHVGSTAMSGSVGVTQIDTVGFNPDLVFLTTNALNTNGTGSVDGAMSFGVAHNGGNQRLIGWASGDNADPSAPNAGLSTAYAIGRISASSGYTWTAVAQGFDADGFELDVSTTTVALVKHLSLKFANSPDVAVISTSLPTSGDYAEAGVGFTPTFGLAAFMGGLTSSNTTSTTTGIRATIAAFDSSSLFSQRYWEEDAQATTDTSSVSNNANILITAADGSADAAFITPVFDADGWDFTVSDSPAYTVYGWGLAIGAGATAALGIRNPLFGPVTLRNPLGRFN